MKKVLGGILVLVNTNISYISKNFSGKWCYSELKILMNSILLTLRSPSGKFRWLIITVSQETRKKKNFIENNYYKNLEMRKL